MKKLPLSLCFFVFALAGCRHERPEPWSQPAGVPLQMQCRILCEPLSSHLTPMATDLVTRASGNDLYGVQVWEETGGGLTPYAYGLFDDVSQMNLELLSGSRYRFEVTLLLDGKDHLQPNFSGAYRAPFTGANVTNVTLTNAFVLESDGAMTDIGSGKVYLASAVPVGQYDRSPISRLHGVAQHVTPTEGGTVELTVKWVIFGLTINPIGFTEGKLTLEMEGAPPVELQPGDPLVDKRHYTFKRPNPATDDWLSDTYSEAIPMQITWTRADETQVVILERDDPEPLVFHRRMNRTISLDFSVVLPSVPTNNGMGIGRESGQPLIGSETTEIEVPTS